jgi:RHS repeat-associated protein
LGRLREVQLPDGKAHRVEYDAHGRVSRVHRDDIATIEYAYDGTSGLLTEKRLYGSTGVLRRKVVTIHDAIGRVSQELHQDVATLEKRMFQFYYDGGTPSSPSSRSQLGLLTAVTGQGYEKVLTYRADGKLTSRRLTLAGGWRELETRLEYSEAGDMSGQATTARGPDGVVVLSSVTSEAFDAYGRGAATRLGGAPLATYAYDGDGLLRRADFAAPDYVELGYDDVTRSLSGSVQRTGAKQTSFQRRMNARGMVESDEIAVGALSIHRAYGYSVERFLAESTDERATSAYGYAPSGIPSSITENGAITSIAIDKDDLGRTTQRGDLSLRYGPDGHLSAATRNGQTWTFLYDEAGQRLLKYSRSMPIAAYPEEGYLDAGGLIQPVKVAQRTVGLLVNGVFESTTTDLLGSVIADGDGSPRIPSPYGSRWLDGAPTRSAALDYVDKGFDADLGLIRMGVRDYDPDLAVFTTPDPLFLEAVTNAVSRPGETNLFGYALSDPLVNADPSGEEVEILTTADPTFRPAAEAAVKQIAPSAKIDAAGKVTIPFWSKVWAWLTGDTGTKLMGSLASSKQKVTVDQQVVGGGNKTRFNAVDAQNKVRTDALVLFEPGANPGIMTEGSNKIVTPQSRPDFIGLAHEMIHALHVVNGDVSSGTGTWEYQTPAGSVIQTRPLEELRTVGLNGFGDWFGPSENDIREDHKLPRRGAY